MNCYVERKGVVLSMNKPTVLICDDNIAVHKSLESYLAEEMIEMISVFDGEKALEMFHRADLIVLDIMLPVMNGVDVCRKIRKSSDIPIIMLSAKGSELDRVVGLEVGADDYVTKPFSPREVTIRIQKTLRKQNIVQQVKTLVLAELTIYPESYEVFVNDKKIDMTPKEVQLLSYFVYNAGKVMSREAILNVVWGYDYLGDTRTVDSHVKTLRRKISHDGAHFSIRSIYGIGYKLEEIS